MLKNIRYRIYRLVYRHCTKIKKALSKLFKFLDLHNKCMKNNSIHVSGTKIAIGITKEQEYILYSNVTYGSSISISNKNLDIGENKWYQYSNLAKTKNNIVSLQLIKNASRSFLIHIYLGVLCQILEDPT